MTEIRSLAAGLDRRHVVAVPVGEAIRAWLPGQGSETISIYPVGGAEPVWAWRNGNDQALSRRNDRCPP